MKKVIKPFIILVLLIYIGLYYVYNNGYYEDLMQREQTAMKEMVKKYEEDLLNGVDVSKNDYTYNRPDYSNTYTKTSLRLSHKIESVIDTSIKFIFKKISNMVNE